MAEQLKRTPLFDIYASYGGKTIDFGGWELPVQFSSIKAEHEAVTVVEPVGALEAMPDQIGHAERKACNEDQDQYTRNDLLAHGIFAGQKIRR